MFSSKSASAEAGKRLTQLVADVQASGKLTDPELVRWVSGLPERMRKQLATWRLIQPDRVAAGRTLSELLDQWQAAIRAKGSTARQAGLQRKRAGGLVEACGFRRLHDVNRGRVEKVLADWRADTGRRCLQRTSNFYGAALAGFCRWCVRERLLSSNPLGGSARQRVTDERTRRALLPDDQAALIATAESGPVRYGVSPHSGGGTSIWTGTRRQPRCLPALQRTGAVPANRCRAGWLRRCTSIWAPGRPTRWRSGCRRCTTWPICSGPTWQPHGPRG